jgi:hypothetical protein
MIRVDKDIDSLRRNYSTSTRLFYKYLNAMKKKKEEVQNEENIKLVKNCDNDRGTQKNIKIEDNKKKNNEMSNKQFNLFNFNIKEREKSPIRILKSQANIIKPKDEKNQINKDINNLDENKTKYNNDNDKQKYMFRRYKNNIKTVEEKNKIINEDKSKFNNDKILKTPEQLNNINPRKFLLNRKKDKLNEIKLDFNFENTGKERQQNLFRRGNKINENNRYISNTESGNKIKEEKAVQNKKNLEINSFSNKIQNSANSHKFQIKNYLVNNSSVNNRCLNTENNKNIIKTSIKINQINNNKIDNNINTNKNEKQENNNISLSKRAEKNKINSNQIQSGKFQLYDTYKSSEGAPINQKKVYPININNNSKYSYKSVNNEQKKIKLNLPYKLNSENDKITKRERVNFSPSPKILIKLDKPPDIIEPKNIDTKKDFPIDDPYIQNNPDIYEEIQTKLKEIIYKVKLPMFNPDLYKIEKKIGEGTHGSIFQVMNIKNGKRYAIKKIFSNDIILLKYIKKEFDLVYEAVHPNILSIYGISVKCFDSNTFSISVLMDLGETDWEIEINEHFYKNKYYTENELMSILKQLVSGLVYLQKEKKIAHRDVKPENVIIFKNNIYKLGDFGEAKGTKRADKLSTLRGTDTYMSPILYKGLKMAKEDVVHDLYKSDVFSLGYSILYAVSLNHDIINEIRDLEKMEDITKILFKRMKPRYSEKFINIILKMINPEETKRIDFIALDKLINH